jgi:hypothetical protein
MKQALKLCFAIAIASSLLGCASGARRDEAAAPAAAAELAGQKYSSINLQLSDKAKKLLLDNPKFNPDALKGTIQRMLEARGLLQAGSPYRIDVEVTDLRVRSNFSAVMFGFMAGADSVAGSVSIADKDGRRVSRYEVSASYALGGIAGGQDETRMGWLYEEFAKHVVNELPAEARK